MSKTSNAKKLLLSLGLGLGIGLSNVAVGVNCSYLLEKCEGPGSTEYVNAYCKQFFRYCGNIP